MKITLSNLVKIILDASQKTVEGLKDTTAKLEFFIKVVSLVLQSGVKLEDMPTGARDLNVRMIAADVIGKIKDAQAVKK